MSNEKYKCKDLMLKKGLKFELGTLNNLNGYAGCGKSTLLLTELIENTESYIKDIPEKYKSLNIHKNRILYVTDTKNLKKQIMEHNKCRELKGKVIKEYVQKDIDIENLTAPEEIIVCTYYTLGCFLKDERYVKWFISQFWLVIFDESHNLADWYYKFAESENYNYDNIMYNLKLFVDKTLFICASATNDKLINYVKSYHSEDDNKIKINTIFNEDNIKKLVKLKEKKTEYYIDIDKAYERIPKWIEKGKRIFIYEKKINDMKNLSDKFEEQGFKTLMIWSDSNTKHKMTSKQEKDINTLLKDEYAPEEYDIVIINDATTTGINIKNEDYQICIINSVDKVIREQGRARLRHDIDLLILPYEENVDSSKLLKYTVDFVDETPKNIPNKYLDKELTPEKKMFLIDKYCPSYCDKNYTEFKKIKSWREFKKWLTKWGYKIKNDNIISKEENDKIMISNYLDSLKGKKLFKNEQQELKEIFIKYELVGRNSGINSLNGALKDKNLPYEILPKKSDSTRYWIIEGDVDR